MKKGGGLEECKSELEREMEGNAWRLEREERDWGQDWGGVKVGLEKLFKPLPRTFVVGHGNRTIAAADWSEGSAVKYRNPPPFN